MRGFASQIISEKDIDLFLSFIKRHRGLDLSSYRKTFIMRRLKSRFNARDVHSLGQYIQIIKNDPGEWNSFLDVLSINVSEFFRDLEVFSEFQKLWLPRLIARKKELGHRIIRCWSCGCAHGEEPYSLAIVFRECLKKGIDNFSIRIWATDVDEVALKKAKEGVYSGASIEKVDAKILNKYFVPISDNTWKVKDEVKNLVRFRKHNLLVDKPLAKMDVVFFRNVGIYFSGPRAEKIFLNIYNSLRKEGYLVLGKVEYMRPSLRQLFKTLSVTNRIFKKI
jgi:chemotaxis protein methyltransferase CheR